MESCPGSPACQSHRASLFWERACFFLPSVTAADPNIIDQLVASCWIPSVRPSLEVAPNWRRLKISVTREVDVKILYGPEHSDHPSGDLATPEQNRGRILRCQKPEPNFEHSN